MAAIELEETIVVYPSVEAMEAADAAPKKAPKAKKEPKEPKAKEPKAKEPKAKEPKAKEPKPPKPIKKACNVPKRTTKLQSVIWMRYVYDILKEAQVEITDEIIDAYNNVITFLEGYLTITILSPSKWERYESILPYDEKYYSKKGIFVNYSYALTKEERTQFRTNLTELYDKFYALVKDKVVPYMANKKKHIEATAIIVNAKRHILALHEKVELQTQIHNKQIKYYHDHIRDLQADIITSEKILAELSF